MRRLMTLVCGVFWLGCGLDSTLEQVEGGEELDASQEALNACTAPRTCGARIDGRWNVASCEDTTVVMNDPFGLCPDMRLTLKKKIVRGTLTFRTDGSFKQHLKQRTNLSSLLPHGCLANMLSPEPGPYGYTGDPTTDCNRVGAIFSNATDDKGNPISGFTSQCRATAGTCRCEVQSPLMSDDAQGSYKLGAGHRVAMSPRTGLFISDGQYCRNGRQATLEGQMLQGASTDQSCEADTDCGAGRCGDTPEGKRCYSFSFVKVRVGLVKADVQE